MRAALRCAKKGLKEGEVPIGAVVVYEDKVVSRGYNRRAKTQLASAHAEMMAIDKACRKFSSWPPAGRVRIVRHFGALSHVYGRGAQRARGQAVFRGLRTEGALFDEGTRGGKSAQS